MSMNPRVTTDKIKYDYQDYIASILSVKDQEITSLAHKAVKSTQFVKGPYLETTLPFVDGKSLKELAEEGLVSKEFSKMGSGVHYSDWKLRIHQESALRKVITDKKNIVVSTGTGSGKTECYLYPIFNSLMREKEKGTLDAGVRALLIFPMNALANDQQKKLRKLLKDYPDITFGRYTGETPHKGKKESAIEAEMRLHLEYDSVHMHDTDESLRKSIKNEMMCREMMAEKPPHILLTNYAMLEYMLLRPDTAPFFDTPSAKNWKFIVIDEAHTYKGANGTEIAFLLRRLKERIRKNMSDDFQCIATSATLGSNDDKGKAGLAAFAQNLFGEPFNASDVVTTVRKERDIPKDGRAFNLDDYDRLKRKADSFDENERGAFLFKELSKDFRLFSVYEELSKKPRKIDDVASVVFSDILDPRERENALISLIELAAAAKKSEYEAALLPARYHLFVKSLEGMFAQYYPRKMVYLDRKERAIEGGNAYSVFELANCQKCNQEYLVGKTAEKDNGSYFVQTSSDDKPEYYFVSDAAQIDVNDFDEDDIVEEVGKISDLDKYNLCLCCGKIKPFAEAKDMSCCANTDTKKIVTVYNLKYSGKDNESNCCPCCGATRKGLIKRFLTANQPATFAVAKSLYDAIPPRPIRINQNSSGSDDLFGDDLFFDEDDSISSDFMPEELVDESGRKLLIFSDNRQEAAFFAGFFEKKYCLLMWRKVIIKCLKDADKNTLNIRDLITKVMREAEKSGLYTFDQESKADMTDIQKETLAAHYVMQEFLNPDIVTGLEGLGYIQIEPDNPRINASFELAGLKGDDLWAMLRYMFDSLRQKGAVTYPETVRATDDFFAPKNHAGYFRQQGSKTELGGYTYGFIPQDKTPNKRLGLMKKVLNREGIDKETLDAEAREKLNEVYQLILRLKEKKYIIDTTDTAKGTVYCLNYARWNFRYINDDDSIYRCKKCGKIYGYSIKNMCPEMKCDGELEVVKAKEVRMEPYYRNQYADTKLIPMVSREHTAQLSSKTAGEYQKDFEEGRINVLSCSTTFEMGVDVGELEATFQRNVPPETANYIQRAGRAGRRTSSAAFSVTFSRRSSHDMTFFQNPAQIIAGKINAPILEIENEKIASRHLNSIVVAWFFKKHREFFDGNTEKIISYGAPDNMAIVLRECLLEHPQDLLDSIHEALPKNVCDSLRVDEWAFIEDIAGDEGVLTKAIFERDSDIDGLKKFAKEAFDNPDDKRMRIRAFAAEKLVSTLEDEASINFLSAKGVLPKYGFPVDTVSLDIISGSDEEAKKIDLSRDLRMAISEFAPPAQVVANGRVWKSYAINTIPDKGWPTYIYYECPKCKRVYPPLPGVTDVTDDLEEIGKAECKICGTLMNPKKFIIPLFGFSTQMGDVPKPVGEARPSTYYSTQTQFWTVDKLTEKQQAEVQQKVINFKGKEVQIEYSPGGKFFVLNQGHNGRGLRICPSCGFANDPATILKAGKHDTKFKKPCSNRNFVFASLGHDFSTDILRIKFPMHDIVIDGADDKDQYMSILYALLEGASSALGISRDDISGCLNEFREIILFDDTPGGSGYVKEIFANFEAVVKAAKNKVGGMCGCTEETSCYGCLRNYSNQFYHDELSRGLALHYLEWLLNSNDVFVAPSVKNEPAKKKDKSEELGLKKSNYGPVDNSAKPDSETQLAMYIEETDDDIVKSACEKLIAIASCDVYEHPTVDEDIQIQEGAIWPDLFWGNSHVALFSKGKEAQYKLLKKYDWYCYMLDENVDAELVFSHIKKG